MNKQKLSAVPDENRIEELLGKIQPVPGDGFHQKMKQAPWLGKQNHPSLISFRMRMAIAMTVVIILATMAVTPQGRAWAQEVFQFFRQVDSTTIPLSTQETEWLNAPAETYELPLVPIIMPTVAPEIALLPDCEAAEKAQSYPCQIVYAESHLGFDLKELPEKPKNLGFDSVQFDKIKKSATIKYGNYGMELRLTQRFGQAPEQYGPWSWVPKGEVEKIKVGPFDGEYVSGSFGLPTDGNALVWFDHDIAQRVAWSDGTYWYLLEESIDSGRTGYLNHDQLIELAANLVNAPIIQEEKINQYSLSSISEAEKYTGLDLKAPTLLPLGYEFSYAGYYLFNQEVQLRYDGSNGYMVIHEWVGKSIDFGSHTTTYKNYEIVKVHGRDAFYGFVEGQSPYLLLWWKEDDLNYQMYFYWYTGAISGTLSKDKMIAIANSMGDINVFKNNAPKPYEALPIYEKALGIDVLEFPTPPVGWRFLGIYADAWSNCIGLSYVSTTGQGQLHLSQCSTDKQFEMDDIPASAMERVKVGKNKAQYVTGNYEYDSNGKLVWQSDLPLRQLRWKKNGLWIQIFMNRGNAMPSDKDDLISYAESLQ